MGTATYCNAFSVLVVDDHEVVRRGIISLLTEIPGARLVGEAGCGEDAVRLARSLLPDVVLMDLRMPGMGGLEAARRIRMTVPQVRVVAVTAWSDEPGQRLLRNGVSACVGKTITRAELETVLLRVLHGNSHAIAEPSAGSAAANPFDALTGREMQVCSLMLAGQRPAAIADRLFITAKTVHTFRYRIYEKLGIKGDLELARLATSHGLIGVNP
jgi:DNA-binding NarL/FixJ family response regulator